MACTFNNGEGDQLSRHWMLIDISDHGSCHEYLCRRRTLRLNLEARIIVLYRRIDVSV
jgi:hypothetical protein